MSINQWSVKKPSVICCLLIVNLMIMLSTAVYARENADPPAVSGASTSIVNKPAWMTELSFGIKEGYDDNILGVSGNHMPRSYSWLTTLSPKIGIDFAKLIDSQNVLQELSFKYQPESTTFSQASEENNIAHRLLNTIKAKMGDTSLNLDNAFVYVDGSNTAPIYSSPDNVRSSYAHAMPRERRHQYQDQMKLNLKVDLGPFFVRPAGSLQFWDMLTDQKTTSGYQNWVDRYDINGGMDVGRSISSQMAVFLGYRYGHQYQGNVLNSKYSSTNDYQRAIAGVEGKLFKWLTLSIVAGPDFRQYDDTAPVNNKNQVDFYGESSLTAEITKKDAVTLKYKAQQWISSSGQVPTFDTGFDLGYRHKFLSTLAWNLNGQIKNADYTVGNLNTGSKTSLRNDWLYGISTGLSYDINENIGVNFNIAANFGRNEQDGITNADYREFDQCVTSIGVFTKF